MLPVNRDSASSVYLQVRVALLNDPLFAPSAATLLCCDCTASDWQNSQAVRNSYWTSSNPNRCRCSCTVGAVCVRVRFKLSHFPLPTVFSNYAVIDGGIDWELYLCVVTGAFSHRPIVAGAFVVMRSFSLYKQTMSSWPRSRLVLRPTNLLYHLLLSSDDLKATCNRRSWALSQIRCIFWFLWQKIAVWYGSPFLPKHSLDNKKILCHKKKS